MKPVSSARCALLPVLLLIMIMVVACSDDNPVTPTAPTWHWSKFGDGVPYETRAVENFGGELYAGGYGGLSVARGSQWVGVLDRGPVYGLITYDDRLIAAGSFASASGLTVNNIAAWDGTSWSALGGGLPAGMTGGSMAVFNGQLIVGRGAPWWGDFYIMAWDGHSWAELMSGGTGMVFDMCVYNGELIVTADSTVDHGTYMQSFPRVRSWDGSSWTSMDDGAGTARGLAVMDDTLYLAAQHSPHLRSWTGTTWESRSSAVFEDDEHGAGVYSIAYHDGRLVLGGDFDYIEGDTIVNIATWDRTSFAPIAGGLTGRYDPRVHVLECIGERLIVGGQFATAGNVNAVNIAEWSYK